MTHSRYPAPAAASLFSDLYKIDLWRKITDEYAHQYIDEIDSEAVELHEELQNLKTPSPEAVKTREQETGHDVVAFLQLHTEGMSDELSPYVHVGLTSSDLVEYALHQQASDHAQHMGVQINLFLDYALARWQFESTIRPGRTHGQIADHTSWSHQMMVHHRAFEDIRNSMWEQTDRMKVIKTPGPTGWVVGSEVARTVRGSAVALAFGSTLVPATQVVHRDRLLAWACQYLRLACALENLALLVRLGARADVAEVREGASRIGSSAMPHKQNPIDSEKVCGLARVARGYFHAISEDVALWEDRDLTNSSLERVAVPGLASTVEHMLITMDKVMRNLIVDAPRMRGNATSPRTMTNIMQTAAQDMLELGPIEAGDLIRQGIAEYPEMPEAWISTIVVIMEKEGMDGEGWRSEVRRRFHARFGDRPVVEDEEGDDS